MTTFSKNNPAITWIDVETNGLDPNHNQLLEVACLVTDSNLNILDESGFTAAVLYREEEVSELRNAADSYVQNMHDATGLWERLLTGKDLQELDDELLGYVQSFVAEPQVSWLGGNSITLDRNFLAAYQPKTFGYLSYRSIDVSSWAGPFEWWKGLRYEKTYTHNAMNDIRESISQLKFFKQNIL